MKKVLFIIKRSAGYFEIWINKRFVKRMKNLGRCVIFIAQYIVEARIQNYEIYGFERGRQILVKDFNAEVIYDFAKNKKDSIISFGNYDDEDDENDDEEDYLNDDESDIRSHHKISHYGSVKKTQYRYVPRDNSYDLEVLKDNLKNLLR